MIDLLKAKEEEKEALRTNMFTAIPHSSVTIELQIENLEQFTRENWEEAYLGLESIVQQILREQ